MKIVDVVYLNENGIGEDGFRYFDDNGDLPDGNYDTNNLEGKWALINDQDIAQASSGFISDLKELLTWGKPLDLDNDTIYAYRTIDNTTLIPISEIESIRLIKDKITAMLSSAKEVN